MAAASKSIVNLTHGTVVCEHAVIADRAFRRLRGLLGRGDLPAHEGLLLQPAPSIHTAFMRFPIDVVFLDHDLQVVKLVENLHPWRLVSARRARAALELAAGQAAARRVQTGDRLALVTIPTSTDATDRGARHQPLKVIDGAADPLHVLLVGSDRRFRSVTSALLTRRGCTVTLGERLDVASTRARQESPDVVVIDGDASPAAAAREAAEIGTLEPRVGIVVVGEERNGAMPPAPALSKSAPFDDLYAAITSARPNLSRRHSHGGS